MAKRTNLPPAPKPDEIDESLIAVAEMVLSDHFFDADSEQDYKKALSADRPVGTTGLVLEEETLDLPTGECKLQIEALRTLTHFRVIFAHPDFSATVEGSWSFANEAFSQATVVARTGDRQILETAVDLLVEELEGAGLDDEEFADFIAAIDEDEEEVPMIGDDPVEPPEATPLDRSRVKAIAKRVARKPDAEMNLEDRSWLEQTPQTLPVITESVIAAASASKRDEGLVDAYQQLLSLQLQFVRYRQDRGWEWANEMLDTFQQRLIALGIEKTIPQTDWFTMAAALTEARVPVSDAVQTALAEAGFNSEDAGPPEEMLRMLRGFMDELAEMVSSPFEVIHTLQNSGAMMPAMLRGFMATELVLSPHEVLRDAVPVMLLDDDSSVRRSAAAALEQSARPDTLSPASLRRAITLRNWIPQADRPVLDNVIRTARLAGVEIGAWPLPVSDLEFHASTIDGSGAQSILIVSRSGKKGLFAGLLLRHGTGVVDTWVDQDLSRGKINKLLREAQMSAPFARVDKTYVDQMVQHAIGTTVEKEAVPPALLVEMAELIGGAEWRDRRLDVKAEAERLFDLLSPADRSPEGIEAGFARGLEWMAADDVFSSWYEDGPRVQQTLSKLPRTDQLGMTALTLADILPETRPEWTERFLLMALWCQAAADAKQRTKARDLVLVAHALAGEEPLGAIPIMAIIAMQTVRANLLGAW